MTPIYLSLAWIAGIYLGGRADYPWIALSGLVLVSIAAVPLPRKPAIILALCLLALLGGVIRLQYSIPVADEAALRFHNDNGTVTIKGVIDNDPEQAGPGVTFRLKTFELEIEGQRKPVSGNALVYARRFSSQGDQRDLPYYRYGDLVEIQGQPETPQALPGFDYAGYLARQGIHSIIRYPAQIKLLAENQGGWFQGWLYRTRDHLSGALKNAIHDPQASLAQAILVGDRSSIPGEINEAFVATGTAHLIAISGQNISILAGLILSLTVFAFGRRRPTYFLAALTVLWLYAMITGLQAPVMRAAIMAGLWLFADFIGRPSSALTSLMFAAAVMVGIQPSTLGDISFQLSFASMVGLVLITPRFQALGRKALRLEDESRSFRIFCIDSLSVTLGATLAILPLTAFYFGKLSLITLPANFFAVPAMPFIVVGSAITGILGLFVTPLAQLAGWATWLFISYMIRVLDLFSSLPLASVDVAGIGRALVWGYYTVLGVVLWATSNPEVSKRLAEKTKNAVSTVPGRTAGIPLRFIAVPLIIFAALLWTAALAAPDSRMHVYFLDVGQGDATLVRTPAGQNILFDGGPAGGGLEAQIGARLPFWQDSIDLMVLTHPHQDHLDGLEAILRRYDVKQVLLPPDDGSPAYREFRRLVAEEKARTTEAESGQHIDLGADMILKALSPYYVKLQNTDEDVDNNSIVVKLVYNDFSLLITGDIHEEAEKYLVAQKFDLRSTALKVAHHGSDTSTSREFVDAVDPQLAVISVGANNTFGHPAQVTLDRLNNAQVYRTDQHGTVELVTDGKRLWVKTEKQEADRAGVIPKTNEEPGIQP